MAMLARVVSLIWLVTQAHMANSAKTYIAAVVEHETIYSTPNGEEFLDTDAPVDKDTALNMMLKNVDVYEERAKEAKHHHAQIIVFPENGIHGFEYTREGVYPFLQAIPDPTSFQSLVTPCVDKIFREVPVIQRLSCIAKKYEIVLVANLGDVQTCDTMQSCNKDGRLQFNTDVVFDSDGTFLLKYHKHYLYHEDEYDTPEHCSYPTFNTSFGVRFGVVTCFDLMFEQPAFSLVRDLKIKNIAFPTAWPNLFPMMASYTFHHSWSWKNRVNLLAANHHRLTAHMTGSGIYSRGEVLRLYFNHTKGSDGQLLIAELNALEEDDHDADVNLDRGGEVGEALRTSLEEEFTEALKSTSSHENGLYVGVANGENEDKLEHEARDDRDIKFFQSVLLFDEYKFIRLTETKGNITVCDHEICCNLIYSKEDNTKSNEFYALGVYTGFNNLNPVHLSVCALVRCADESNDSCGQYVRNASTVFDRFSLRGNFTEGTNTYPIVVVGEGLLISPSLDGIRFDGNSLEGVLEKPLVSACLFGRMYEKDTQYPSFDCKEQPQVLS